MRIFGIIFGSIGILAGVIAISIAVLGISQFSLIWYGVAAAVLGGIMVGLFPKWAKE